MNNPIHCKLEMCFLLAFRLIADQKLTDKLERFDKCSNQFGNVCILAE